MSYATITYTIAGDTFVTCTPCKKRLTLKLDEDTETIAIRSKNPVEVTLPWLPRLTQITVNNATIVNLDKCPNASVMEEL